MTSCQVSEHRHHVSHLKMWDAIFTWMLPMKFITVHDIFLRKQIWTAGRPVEFTHADDTLVIESGLPLSWECSWDKYHLPPIPPSAVVILIINTNLMLNTIPDR